MLLLEFFNDVLLGSTTDLNQSGGFLGSGQTRMCLKMVSFASGFGGTVQPKPFQSVDVTLW